MSQIIPTVTIGIPYYNDLRYLSSAIRSVLAQQFTDWELLLVDDGSTDDSPCLAKSFADARIRHLCDGRNMGLSWRLNQIASEARGRFLFRMDADDLMHPNRVAAQLELLQGSPKNTVVGSAAIEIDEGNRPMRILRSRRKCGTGYSARRAFLHPTVAAYTEWFRTNRYSESLLFRRIQDNELWVRTAPLSNFVVMEAPLMFYRWTESQAFDKRLWQVMALLKILSRPQAGGRVTRLGYSMMELAKLQMRFLQEIGFFQKAFLRPQSRELTEDEQRHFAAIIAQVSKA